MVEYYPLQQSASRGILVAVMSMEEGIEFKRVIFLDNIHILATFSRKPANPSALDIEKIAVFADYRRGKREVESSLEIYKKWHVHCRHIIHRFR